MEKVQSKERIMTLSDGRTQVPEKLQPGTQGHLHWSGTSSLWVVKKLLGLLDIGT